MTDENKPHILSVYIHEVRSLPSFARNVYLSLVRGIKRVHTEPKITKFAGPTHGDCEINSELSLLASIDPRPKEIDEKEKPFLLFVMQKSDNGQSKKVGYLKLYISKIVKSLEFAKPTHWTLQGTSSPPSVILSFKITELYPAIDENGKKIPLIRTLSEYGDNDFLSDEAQINMSSNENNNNNNNEETLNIDEIDNNDDTDIDIEVRKFLSTASSASGVEFRSLLRYLVVEVARFRRDCKAHHNYSEELESKLISQRLAENYGNHDIPSAKVRSESGDWVTVRPGHSEVLTEKFDNRISSQFVGNHDKDTLLNIHRDTKTRVGLIHTIANLETRGTNSKDPRASRRTLTAQKHEIKELFQVVALLEEEVNQLSHDREGLLDTICSISDSMIQLSSWILQYKSDEIKSQIASQKPSNDSFFSSLFNWKSPSPTPSPSPITTTRTYSESFAQPPILSERSKVAVSTEQQTSIRSAYSVSISFSKSQKQLSEEQNSTLIKRADSQKLKVISDANALTTESFSLLVETSKLLRTQLMKLEKEKSKLEKKYEEAQAQTSGQIEKLMSSAQKRQNQIVDDDEEEKNSDLGKIEWLWERFSTARINLLRIEEEHKLLRKQSQMILSRLQKAESIIMKLGENIAILEVELAYPFLLKSTRAKFELTAKDEIIGSLKREINAKNNEILELKKQLSSRSAPVRYFGSELDRCPQNEEGLPLIFTILIQTLEVMNAHLTEGIFRECGSKLNIESIQLQCEKKGRDLVGIEGDYNVHDIASLLKKYLRDLPEPLIRFQYFDQLVNIFQKTDSDRDTQILEVKELVNRLPEINKLVLKNLCIYLNKISSNQSINHMSNMNLAVCLSPTLVYSNDPQKAFSAIQPLRDACKFIFDEFQIIFDL